MNISCFKNSFNYDFKLSQKKKIGKTYSQKPRNEQEWFYIFSAFDCGTVCEHLTRLILPNMMNDQDFKMYSFAFFLIINKCLYLHHCSYTVPQEM